MKKMTCVLAILAAASTAAVAKDLKQEKKATPVVTAAQMTDSEMDKVAAGAYLQLPNGRSVFPNWSGQGAGNAGHGFHGNGAHCAGCGFD
jgi:hypothetical protein